MKMKAWSVLLLVLLAGTAQAQMFKWVDEKGVTHFSDTPPRSRITPIRWPT
jgi:hypothetical protein